MTKRFKKRHDANWLIRQGLNVEFGNACKLKCPACARTFFTDTLVGSSVWRFDNYKPILDAGYEFLFCGSHSDPIYHPDFLDTIEYLMDNDKCVEIDTNGTGKTIEWWTKAFTITSKHLNKGNFTRSPGTEWVFALDGFPEDSHKYRVNQDGEQVWEVMKLGASMGCTITWQFIVFNYNENDIDQCRHMAEYYGINFKLIRSTRWWPLTEHLKPSSQYTKQRRAVTNGMKHIQKSHIDPKTKRVNYGEN